MGNYTQQEQVTLTASIASGAAATAWLPTKGGWGFTIAVPEGWTAADLTVEISNDAGTSNLGKLRLAADGKPARAVTDATTPKGVYTIETSYGVGVFSHFRLVSTNKASEADVNQAAARALTIGVMR